MPAQGPTPVQNPTKAFWSTGAHALNDHRSTADIPSEADIVIIGAGFAGAALAHYIYKDESQNPTVVIFEAREACSGATGRNGGQMKPDVYFQLPKYIKKYGVKAALEVAKFEASHVKAVKELVEEENIDCEFTLTRTCDVYLDEELAKQTHDAFVELKKSNVANLDDVHLITRKDAERVSGVKGALCALTFTAGHVWPYKMVMHLLQGAVNKGANLQTHTPVTGLSDKPDPDGRWLVRTARGTVKAKKVLLATNAYTSSLAPEFKDHIVPVRGICSHIKVPEGRVAPLLTQTYSLKYGPGLYDYLIPRVDGSIIVGGAKPHFWHDPSHWYNVHDDSKLIEPAEKHFDGLMQRNFLGWENSEAYPDKIWTGIMGFSSDYMPYLGEVPGKPGQVVLAGFSGHGMPLILLSAKAIVEVAMGRKSFEETGVPHLFKCTRERLDSTQNEILAGHSAKKSVKQSKL